MFQTLVLLAYFAASRAGGAETGEKLETAVRSLASKIAPHLAPTEAAHLSVNGSTFPAVDVGKVRTGLAQSLQRRGRKTSMAEIAVTISENLQGYLLVAEIVKRDSINVEMVAVKSEPTAALPALPPIAKRLIWQQAEPILDLLDMGEQMVVLEPRRLVRYERSHGEWVAAESDDLAAPPVRDPRGRMEANGDDVKVFLPTATCRGTWRPMKVACEAGTADFPLNSTAVHFTAGRNLIEGQGAGDAIAVCGNKTLASSASGMDAVDSVVLSDGAAAVSEPLEFSGPVTALWPSSGGALAVARNITTKDYAAYALSLDCGR